MLMDRRSMLELRRGMLELILSSGDHDTERKQQGDDARLQRGEETRDETGRHAEAYVVE